MNNAAKHSIQENNNASPSKCSTTEIINVVRSLDLKTVKCDEPHSNSSSLRSTDSLLNHQGSLRQDETDDSGSTSCSEDSFEMFCSNSGRNDKTDKNNYLPKGYIHGEEISERHLNNLLQEDCLTNNEHFVSKDYFSQIRKNVAKQMGNLDTSLPHLDFKKLEIQLALSSKEENDSIKNGSSECFLRSTKQQKNYECDVNFKTKTGVRLPTTRNLKVCYMNELDETDADNCDNSADSDIERSTKKSDSYPNFKRVSVSISPTANVLNMININKKMQDDETLSEEDKCKILRDEAIRVMQIAKKCSSKVLVSFRNLKFKTNEIPRQSRQYLSKTKLTEIQLIHHLIKNAIGEKNKELVELLIERDNLHMEYDSFRTDIDDFNQQQSSLIVLDMRKLMLLQKGLYTKYSE